MNSVFKGKSLKCTLGDRVHIVIVRGQSVTLVVTNTHTNNGTPLQGLILSPSPLFSIKCVLSQLSLLYYYQC